MSSYTVHSCKLPIISNCNCQIDAYEIAMVEANLNKYGEISPHLKHLFSTHTSTYWMPNLDFFC